MFKTVVLLAIGVGIAYYAVYCTTKKKKATERDIQTENAVEDALIADRNCWPVWKISTDKH